jgi:hypothetical protein
LEVLVASAGLEEPVALAGLVVSVGLAGLVVSVGLVELEELEGLVESAAETVHPLCRLAAATGSITLNIAAAPLIEIGRPRIGLVARRAVIRLPTVRLVPGVRFNGRVAISAATELVAGAPAIGPAGEAWVTEREEVAATGLAEVAEAIASETGMSPAAEAGTGTPSEAGTGGIAVRVLALAVTAAHRAWAGAEAEADVAVVAVVGGDGNRLSC